MPEAANGLGVLLIVLLVVGAGVMVLYERVKQWRTRGP